MAENVRVGFVKGMWIRRFFPRKLTVLSEKDLNFLSSFFSLLHGFPTSPELGESVNSASSLFASSLEFSASSSMAKQKMFEILCNEKKKKENQECGKIL